MNRPPTLVPSSMYCLTANAIHYACPRQEEDYPYLADDGDSPYEGLDKRAWNSGFAGGGNTLKK